jgi:hypothetical protein
LNLPHDICKLQIARFDARARLNSEFSKFVDKLVKFLRRLGGHSFADKRSHSTRLNISLEYNLFASHDHSPLFRKRKRKKRRQNHFTYRFSRLWEAERSGERKLSYRNWREPNRKNYTDVLLILAGGHRLRYAVGLIELELFLHEISRIICQVKFVGNLP